MMRNAVVGVLIVMAFAVGGLMVADLEARVPIEPTTSTGVIVSEVTVPGTTERTTTLPPTIATWPSLQALIGPTRPTSPGPTSTSPRPATTAPRATTGVYWANCTEAINAGAAPILRGEPGYRSALDRDNDGIACETDPPTTTTTLPAPTTATSEPSTTTIVVTTTATASTTTETTSTTRGRPTVPSTIPPTSNISPEIP